jgi:hypothetical protein
MKMKVTHNLKKGEKTYEYDNKSLLVDSTVHARVKTAAFKTGLTVKEFVNDLITKYEDTDH